MQKTSSLKNQNQLLKQNILKLQTQQQNNIQFQTEINQFISSSKNNFQSMKKQLSHSLDIQNQILHQKIVSYQSILKKQIELLNQHQHLSQTKQGQEQQFNKKIQAQSKLYQKQINDFEDKIKNNLKRIKQLGQVTIIKRIIKNPRFKQAMIQRGCKIEILEQQCKIEDISNQVQEKQKLINEQEIKSKKLDFQLDKMQQLLNTMKQLMDTMIKEKSKMMDENILLKKNLKESQQIMAKILSHHKE